MFCGKFGIKTIITLGMSTVMMFGVGCSSEKAEPNAEDNSAVSVVTSGAADFEEAVEIYAQAINKKDFDMVLQILPVPMHNNESVLNKEKEAFDAAYENVESFECKIKSIGEFGTYFDGYVEDLNERFMEDFGETVEVSEAYELEIEAKFVHNDGSEDIESVLELLAYKSDGRWYLTTPVFRSAIGG